MLIIRSNTWQLEKNEPKFISLPADHDYYLENITFLSLPFFYPPQKRILFFSSSQDLSRQANGGLCLKADFTWLVFNPSYLPWSSNMPEPQRQIYHLIDSAVTGTSDEIQFMHKDGRLVTRLLANVLLADRWSRSFVKRSGSRDVRERCLIRNTRERNKSQVRTQAIGLIWKLGVCEPGSNSGRISVIFPPGILLKYFAP